MDIWVVSSLGLLMSNTFLSIFIPVEYISGVIRYVQLQHTCQTVVWICLHFIHRERESSNCSTSVLALGITCLFHSDHSGVCLPLLHYEMSSFSLESALTTPPKTYSYRNASRATSSCNFFSFSPSCLSPNGLIHMLNVYYLCYPYLSLSVCYSFLISPGHTEDLSYSFCCTLAVSFVFMLHHPVGKIRIIILLESSRYFKIYSKM